MIAKMETFETFQYLTVRQHSTPIDASSSHVKRGFWQVNQAECYGSSCFRLRTTTCGLLWKCGLVRELLWNCFGVIGPSESGYSLYTFPLSWTTPPGGVIDIQPFGLVTNSAIPCGLDAHKACELFRGFFIPLLNRSYKADVELRFRNITCGGHKHKINGRVSVS